MIHEIEALEVRRIAELAAEARKLRDRLFEKVPEAALGEPPAVRGPHDSARDVALGDLLAGKPEMEALRTALTSLPADLRRTVWVVMEVGRGRFAAETWEEGIAEAARQRDADLVVALLDEPDLAVCLGKGLYMLGVSSAE